MFSRAVQIQDAAIQGPGREPRVPSGTKPARGRRERRGPIPRGFTGANGLYPGGIPRGQKKLGRPLCPGCNANPPKLLAFSGPAGTPGATVNVSSHPRAVKERVGAPGRPESAPWGQPGARAGHPGELWPVRGAAGAEFWPIGQNWVSAPFPAFFRPIRQKRPPKSRAFTGVRAARFQGVLGRFSLASGRPVCYRPAHARSCPLWLRQGEELPQNHRDRYRFRPFRRRSARKASAHALTRGSRASRGVHPSRAHVKLTETAAILLGLRCLHRRVVECHPGCGRWICADCGAFQERQK